MLKKAEHHQLQSHWSSGRCRRATLDSSWQPKIPGLWSSGLQPTPSAGVPGFLPSSAQASFPYTASPFSGCFSIAFLKERRLYINSGLVMPSPAHLPNHTQLSVIWPQKDAPEHSCRSQLEGEYANMQTLHTFHKSNALDVSIRWNKCIMKPVSKSSAASHLQRCPEKNVGALGTSKHLVMVVSRNWRYSKTV